MLPRSTDCQDLCKRFKGFKGVKNKWYHGEDDGSFKDTFLGQSGEEYYQGNSVYTCDAFPEGIPFDIIRDIRKHYKNVAGDNGIKFELRDDKDKKDLPK